MRSEAVSERALSIRVNGQKRAVASGTTVAGLLQEMALAGRRVAVSVDRGIVPRSAWTERALAAGERVEILEAVGGG